MKLRHSFLAFATLVVTGVGEDAGTKVPPSPAAGTPAQTRSAWLGFSVRKPDPSGGAQLSSLPPGIGFVIQAIAPGGPAEAAQLHPMDVLWKFGDQMLVNQGQLATLINLKMPGDEVTLGIFRAGKPLEINIKLGEAPDDKRGFTRDMIDAVILADDGSTQRIVNMLDRTATLSNNDGKALVRREGEGYKVVINGPDKEVIFDGLLPADGNHDGIPPDWRRRVCVLRRSLDHALESRMVPVRPPRPRVVPPAEVTPPRPGVPTKP
ncbi:MAG: PDZ domain-containing protein [Verrucomicrobia bacterium]|nr:PDZ domain-containing protein [Verrucomicrobiota bacterium]